MYFAVSGVINDDDDSSSPGSSAQLSLLTAYEITSRGISLPNYCTYSQSFNFTATALPEISLDEKVLLIMTQPPSHPSSQFRAGLRLQGALGPNILRGPIYTHS